MKSQKKFAFLTVSIVGICVLFAIFLVFATDIDDFVYASPPDKDMRLLDMFYFTLTTATTVGYGDIVPKTKRARVYIILFHLALFGGLVNLLLTL